MSKEQKHRLAAGAKVSLVLLFVAAALLAACSTPSGGTYERLHANTSVPRSAPTVPALPPSAVSTSGNTMIHASATSSGYVNISNSKTNASNFGTLQITIPANRVLTEINFTVTRAVSALEYYGQEHTICASSYEINATETSLAQYFNISAYYVGFDSIWWYMRFPDAPADVLHVELWCPNGTDHPDVLASENVTNMDDFGATSWGWMEYALPETFNVTCLPTCLWAALNVSELTANDVLVSHQPDGMHDLGPAKTYTVGAWSEPVALAGRDLSCFLYGRRIEPATNGTWEAPSAEDCALSITIDSQTESFSGDELGFTDLVDAVTIDVSFAANLSCDVEMSWEMTLVNVTTEAATVTVTKTVNDTVDVETDYTKYPYVADLGTFLELHGWHLAFLAFVTGVTVLLGAAFVGGASKLDSWAVITGGLIIILLFSVALAFAPGLISPHADFWEAGYDIQVDYGKVWQADGCAFWGNWSGVNTNLSNSDWRWEDFTAWSWGHWHNWVRYWTVDSWHHWCEAVEQRWVASGVYQVACLDASYEFWGDAADAVESVFGLGD